MNAFTTSLVAVLVSGCAGSTLCQANSLPPGRLRGSLVNVDESGLVIRLATSDRQREEVVTLRGNQTRGGRYLINGVPGKLEDLKPGMPITFGSNLIRTEPPRDQLLVVANPEGMNGVITGTYDGKLMLVGWQPGSDETSEMIITPDDQTQFLVFGKPGALTDLRSQMPVSVVPLGNGAGRLIVASVPYGRNAVVVGVEGEDLIVRPRFPELRIVVDETMQIGLDGAPVQVAELAKMLELAHLRLAPPMRVVVVTNRGGRRNVREGTNITVRTDSWRGTILEVRGDYITIDRTFLGRPIRSTVAIDEKTPVLFGGIAREAMRLPANIGTMRELQPGMQVIVTQGEFGPPTTIYVNSLVPLIAPPVSTPAPGWRF